MILNSFNLVCEPNDIKILLLKLTGEVDKLKELTVSLERDYLVLAGKISVGLTIPFTTKWQARIMNEGRAAGLTLAGVSVGMVGMGAEMISAQVLALLDKKLQGFDAVRIEGKEIVIELQPILAGRGITLNASLTKLEITTSGIMLEAVG